MEAIVLWRLARDGSTMICRVLAINEAGSLRLAYDLVERWPGAPDGVLKKLFFDRRALAPEDLVDVAETRRRALVAQGWAAVA